MTMAPGVTTQQRNDQMVERYAAGETLESIGSSYGVTRERVRQIVAKLGGATAEESRLHRIAAREAAITAARAGFLMMYGQLARRIASSGSTRGDAVIRIQSLFPTIDPELADDALRESDIVFDKYVPDNIFSDEAIAAGVWYLLGSELSLAPNRELAAIALPLGLITELRGALGEAQVEAADIATILGIIATAQEHVRDNPAATITGSRYEELRVELVEAMGLESRKGATPWPCTRQTIMKRFGGWSDGLASFGIGTTSRGRTKGLLKYTVDEYRQAMRDFVADAERPNTVEAYHEWVVLEAEAGRVRPSVSSVRNILGTWGEAVRSGLSVPGTSGRALRSPYV